MNFRQPLYAYCLQMSQTFARNSTVLTMIWLTFVLFVNPLRAYSSNNFCKTPDGDVGRCIEPSVCPYAHTKCDDGKVCCPAMQRIVTPSSSPSPINSTSVPLIGSITILPVPIVEVTTQASTLTLAEEKCQEYKHRVEKRSSIVTYVFGGTASRGKEFPHMALLGYGEPKKIEWLCGGSLISDRYVLTAAHCVVTTNLGDLIVVRLGELDIQSDIDDASPQDYGISEKIVHPNYHPPSQYNDIALLKLDQEVEFSSYIAPICIQVNRNLPNFDFVATGWGRTEPGGPQSEILMKVELEYFTNDICQENYEGVSTESLSRGIVDDTQICAGSREDEKDTCQGDSGGPLQVKDDVLYLVGITSFGRACGMVNSPAVYTRVSYYVPWIEDIVWSQ